MQLYIDSPFGAGITEAFNPPVIWGIQESALTITPSLATNPGTYTTVIHGQITQSDITVANPVTPQVTFTLKVAKPTPTALPKGPFNDAIAAASNAAFNISESTSAGPACAYGTYTQPGSCACAWEVNRILNRAGVATIGASPDYVPSVESALIASRGALVPLASALPGDLDVVNSQSHIGICMTAGCTVVYSNSTQYSQYRDRTGPNIFESVPGRIYRVEN